MKTLTTRSEVESFIYIVARDLTQDATLIQKKGLNCIVEFMKYSSNKIDKYSPNSITIEELNKLSELINCLDNKFKFENKIYTVKILTIISENNKIYLKLGC